MTERLNRANLPVAGARRAAILAAGAGNQAAVVLRQIGAHEIYRQEGRLP
jgi:hypothetical protein